MKLFYTPGACSIGIHIILEEIGRPFELEHVDILGGGSRTSEFVAMNPKGKIPVLVRDDGTALTEFPAIAFYLAWAHPEANLLAPGIEGSARSLEMFEYLVSTVHMRGLHRMFGPHRIAPGADEAKVWQEGLDIVNAALALIDPLLADAPYVMGEFSIVDGPLFYVLINAYRLKVELPQNVERYFAEMLRRPSVQRAIATEGIGDWVKPLLVHPT